MKVNAENVAGLSGAPSSRAQETKELDRAAHLRASDSAPPSGQDRAELSGLLGAIREAEGAASAQRAGKVTAISKLHEQGALRVNSRQVSQKLVTELLAARASIAAASE